jgi:phosphohistidine phosphatase
MKTILFMRHAKASWDGKGQDDRDRQVTKRGKKNAEQMGKLLKKEKLKPDLILSSCSTRAQQTAETVIKELKYRGDIYYLNELYLGEPEAYVGQIQTLRDDVERVLVIGHCPTLDSLLQMMTGKVESLATAGVAHLKVPIDSWKEFNPEVQSELAHLWRPKDL